MPSWRRKVRPLDLLLVLISLAYPFVVYFGLVHFSPLTVGLALVAPPAATPSPRPALGIWHLSGGAGGDCRPADGQ